MPTDTPDWADMIVVGRVARAHGIRGQVIVDPQTDFPEERYKAGSTIFGKIGGQIRPLTITDVRFHRGRPIISIDGISTMNDAEELAGIELKIAAADLQPLPAGSFYQHDLVGCDVETPDGVRIGQVTGVEGTGSTSRLAVQGRNGQEILIPMAEDIVIGVHVAARRIVINPIDGLLDLNETRRQRFS